MENYEEDYPLISEPDMTVLRSRLFGTPALSSPETAIDERSPEDSVEDYQTEIVAPGTNMERSEAVRTIITGDADPYAPIRKTESRTEAGNLTGYAIEIESERMFGGEPIGLWDLAGTVGPNYMIVSNSELRDLAYEIVDKSPWEFEEDTVLFDGKKFMLTLDVKDTDVMGVVDASVGDYLGFGLMFHNSYDGTKAASASLYLKQLVCSNGLISTQEFGAYRFRHTYGNEGWEEDVRAALEIVNSAPGRVKEFAERMKLLKGTPVNQEFLKGMRKKNGPAEKVGSGMWASIIDRWAKKEENNAYGFLNACTNVLWHQKNLNQSHLKFNDQIVSGMLGK